MERNLSQAQSACLLAAVIFARSTSFLFSKLLLAELDTFALLALRFLIAFVLLLLLFRRRLPALKRQNLLGGGLLGLCFLGVLTCEMTSLKSCSTSVTSFLENSAVVFVPLLNAVLSRRFPKRQTVIGSLTALAGVALLTLGSTAQCLPSGLLFALGGALLYTVFILLTGKLSQAGDPLLTGLVEVGTVGTGALLLALLRGTFSVRLAPIHYGYLLVLAVVCSGFGFTLQPLAQKGLDTDLAGTLCALSPLSCTCLGALFLHEALSPAALLGCGLILCGILIPCLSARQAVRPHPRKAPQLRL